MSNDAPEDLGHRVSGHKPPKGVQQTGQRAMRWIQDGKAGYDFTGFGRRRARQLADGRSMRDEDIKKMRAFFARHEVDSQADGFKHGSQGYPSPSRVAWDACGGDEGRRWVNSLGI